LVARDFSKSAATATLIIVARWARVGYRNVIVREEIVGIVSVAGKITECFADAYVPFKK